MPEPTASDGPREIRDLAQDVRIRTLTALARKVRCSRQRLSDITRGYLPKRPIFSRLARTLHVPAATLLDAIDYGRRCAYERDQDRRAA